MFNFIGKFILGGELRKERIVAKEDVYDQLKQLSNESLEYISQNYNLAEEGHIKPYKGNSDIGDAVIHISLRRKDET